MPTLVELATQIVAAQTSSSAMSTEDILISLTRIHSTLGQLESGAPSYTLATIEDTKEHGTGTTNITMKEAFKKNEVVCMICGKGGYKTLGRHLIFFHHINPSDYRKRFGIPASQPLSAKAYSETRRKMALEVGLVDRLKKAREAAAEKLDAKKTAAAAKARTAAPAAAQKAAKAPRAAAAKTAK